MAILLDILGTDPPVKENVESVISAFLGLSKTEIGP
jgi:hypothetical protein